MATFFEFIKAYIIANVPEFRKIIMFNDQLEKGNVDRTDKALRYPAVMIQFVTSEIRARSQGCEDVVLQVIFHLAYEGYLYSEKRQLADMAITDKFHSFMQRFRGDETDTVQFTSFDRIIINESEDFDNVNKPILTYRTMLRTTSAYKTPLTVSIWSHDVIGEII
jgi:hypothetical protein